MQSSSFGGREGLSRIMHRRALQNCATCSKRIANSSGANEKRRFISPNFAGRMSNRPSSPIEMRIAKLKRLPFHSRAAFFASIFTEPKCTRDFVSDYVLGFAVAFIRLDYAFAFCFKVIYQLLLLTQLSDTDKNYR